MVKEKAQEGASAALKYKIFWAILSTIKAVLVSSSFGHQILLSTKSIQSTGDRLMKRSFRPTEASSH